MASRATEHDTMEFGEWEVDDSIFEKTSGAGQVQDSLPMRRDRDQRAAAALEEADEDMPGL